MPAASAARFLWINADDFGLTEGVTRGILCSMTGGSVHTTTAMVCSPESRERVVGLGGQIAGRIGVHLQLTDGIPFSPDVRLADASGRFPRRRELLADNLDVPAICEEWRLQIVAFRSLGFEPNHLNTHHDIHWRPAALEAYIQLARQECLSVRSGPPWLARRLCAEGLRCPALTRTFGDRAPITLEGFVEEARLAAAECRPGDCFEISCHPGYADRDLSACSSYVEERSLELEVLCHPDLNVRLQEAGVHLISSWPFSISEPSGIDSQC